MLQCEQPQTTWCLLNDDTVTATSFSALSELPSKFPCDTAYVLFYARTDLPPAPEPCLRSELPLDLRMEIDADNVRLAEDRKREMWNTSMASKGSSGGGSRRGGGGGGDDGGASGGGRCGDGLGSSLPLVF